MNIEKRLQELEKKARELDELANSIDRELGPEDLAILAIIDRTGSMSNMAIEASGSIRGFIETQADAAPNGRIRIVDFDVIEPSREVFDGTLSDAKGLSYQIVPRGGTPLYDAIGMAVADFEPGEHTVVLVVTDGEENSSREWSVDSVKRLIAVKRKMGFEFVFIGAEEAGLNQAREIGIGAAQMSGYTGATGYVGTMSAVSANLCAARGAMGPAGPRGATGVIGEAMEFDDEQRKAAGA